MVRQTMFTAGEVDVQLWKRTDIEGYLSAAQSLLNVEVGTTGIAKKRKGTIFQFDVSAYINPNSQMYEFTDNQGNYYLLMSKNLAFTVFKITGGFAFYQTIVTPYATADLLDIDYTLDNDVLVLTHPNFPPARIYIASYGPAIFSYQVLNIFPYPAYDFGNVNYDPATINYSIAGSVLTFIVTKPVGVFTTAWIGGQIIGAGTNVNDPLGYAIITNVTGANPYTFTANIIVPFLATGFSTVGAAYSIKQPAWSDPATGAMLGWPAKTVYYQNRLWFANTIAQPTTIFGSQINTPLSFDVGIGRDTDAIIYSIGQTNSGPIQWMNGGKQLELFTNNFEFAAPQNEAVGLTPGTFAIRQQSAYGVSANVKPTTYINDSYYITQVGNSIINFHYNGIGSTYTSSNVSVQSTHLVKNPQSRALLRGSSIDQDNYIYYLNEDSTITAFQFAAEYKLAALTPIQFQSNVLVKDLVTINNRVYILKEYTLNAAYAIELLDENTYIDSSKEYVMDSTGLVTGLGIYNGYAVQVLLLGQDYGIYTVVGSQITVSEVTLPATVTIGLLYNVNITPMYTFAGPLESNFYKNISRIFVDYYNSLNFYVNGTFVPFQTYSDIQNATELDLKTGTAIVSPVRGWNRFDTFSITQSSPYDLQITSIAYQVAATII